MHPLVVGILAATLLIMAGWLVLENGPIDEKEDPDEPVVNENLDSTFSSSVTYGKETVTVRVTPSTANGTHTWTVMDRIPWKIQSFDGSPQDLVVYYSSYPLVIKHSIVTEGQISTTSKEIDVDDTKEIQLSWESGVFETSGSYQKYSEYRYREDRTPSMRVMIGCTDPLLLECADYLKTVCAGMDNDETAQTVLSFVQDSISYYTDSWTRGVSDWWQYPYETLFDGTGDCEDTAILFATLGKQLGLETALINYVGHVAGGVVMENGSGTYYEKDSKRYYVCETATDFGRIRIGSAATDLTFIGVIV